MNGDRVSGNMRFDTILLVATLILVCIGMVMVYSASSVVAEARFESSSFFLKRHMFRAMVSIGIMLLVLRMDYHVFGRWSRYMVIGSFGLLLYLLIRKIIFGGVQRWIYLGPISFQPSDLARLSLVLYISDWLAREGDWIQDLRRGLWRQLGIIGITLMLIVAQPDLGTAIFIGMIVAVLLFIGGMRLSHLASLGLIAVPALFLLVFAAGYRENRIKAFLDPSTDTGGISYQVNQSLVSLGTGGVLGVGLGKGRQKHLFLPEPHTDFVFSIIGEELGFAGALSVLILFLVFTWRGLRIARRARDREGFFMAAGLTLTIALYAFFNAAVAMAMVPTKGLPMPFISYGGSSLLLSLVGTGILLNISTKISPSLDAGTEG